MKLASLSILLLIHCPFCLVGAGTTNETVFHGGNKTAVAADGNSLKLRALPPTAKIVPGAYVLVLRDDQFAIDAVDEILGRDEEIRFGRIQYIYSSLLKGLALTGVSSRSLARLLDSSHVLSITPDYEFDLDAVQEFPESWGLDRIDDEESKPLDGKYLYEYSGYGVDVYILDSGLYDQHSDFATVRSYNNKDPRTVKCGYDAFVAPQDNLDSYYGQCMDKNGHGTHVSAILGGRKHGVSKDANLVSVKIFGSSHGSLATVLAGLEFVFQEKLRNLSKPMVALLALSGPRSEIIKAAVEALVDSGVVLVVSAGNDGESSCSKAPASSSKVITVTATDYQDVKPAYANDGPCTDLFAPGHQITSAWIRSSTDSARLSGTSMAAAHVAGVVAQYLEKFPRWNAHEVSAALTVHAVRGAVTGEKVKNWTPNFLLTNHF